MDLRQYTQALGQKVVKIDGMDVNIKAEMKDVARYLKTASTLKDKEAEAIDFQINFCADLISKGDNNLSLEEAKTFVSFNLSETIEEILVAMKLTKRGDMKVKEEAKN